MVAGVDYDFTGVDFGIFCKNRIKRITLKNTKKSELNFTTFDIKKGKITVNDITYPSGKKKESISNPNPTKFKPVAKCNYNGKRFKDGQTDLISILDIYKEVQNVGINHPGTLMELSFFSHAWMGGPLLVNSFDDGVFNFQVPGTTVNIPFSLPVGIRDPDDFDPRGRKDFSPPNMQASDLLNFQNAYHPDGFSWVWGCAFPKNVHKILSKIERHPKYKSSGVSDSEDFQFKNMEAQYVAALEHALGISFPDKRNFTIQFSDLKKFICIYNISSYSQILSNNSKRNVIGGLMGTYSEYDSGKLPLMSVSKLFTRHFTFYKNHLGYSFDKEGRKYGIYTPNKTCP